jgi:hypothetical protein
MPNTPRMNSAVSQTRGTNSRNSTACAAISAASGACTWNTSSPAWMTSAMRSAVRTQRKSAAMPQNPTATNIGHTISQSMRGCSRLAAP